MAVGTAVIGSLQFGYNTGVINAPQKVSSVSANMLFKQCLQGGFTACFSLLLLLSLKYTVCMLLSRSYSSSSSLPTQSQRWLFTHLLAWKTGQKVAGGLG